MKKSRFTETQIVSKRLKELERENARLKKMYADLSLENEALKDLISKKL
jgi:putative transposase